MMYYEAAAYLDSPSGHFSYAALMINDRDDADVELGILHLSRAIAHGHIRAMNFLAHSLYDPTSWLHHHRRESIHQYRQNFSQGNPRSDNFKSSTLRVKEWLNISSRGGRYRILEVNLSNPIRLDLSLPEEHLRLDLAYPIKGSFSSPSINVSQDNRFASTPIRRYLENKHVRWIGHQENGQELKWCETAYKLVKHLAEYHPYGASLSTLTTSTLAPLLQSSSASSSIDPFDRGNSDANVGDIMSTAISMMDLLDEGAELGYQQLQWQSYHVHHRILTDYCPLLPSSSLMVNYSQCINNQSDSKLYTQFIVAPIRNRISNFLVRLLETKFRAEEEYYDDYVVYTERDENPLDSLPLWISNMTSEQCINYFSSMSIKRLIQLANQGHNPAKRLLANMIVSPKTQSLPLKTSSNSSSLLQEAILLLLSSAEKNDLEALLQLGWIIYYDSISNDNGSNRKLAEEIFAMAHDLELQRSTAGILTSLALLCLYSIEFSRWAFPYWNSMAHNVDIEMIWIVILTITLVTLTSVYWKRRSTQL